MVQAGQILTGTTGEQKEPDKKGRPLEFAKEDFKQGEEYDVQKSAFSISFYFSAESCSRSCNCIFTGSL